MKQEFRFRFRFIAACAIALAVWGVSPASPLITIRVTSLDAALRDIETVSKKTESAISREQLLQQLGATFGTEDLSFLDLTQPAALMVPQEDEVPGTSEFVLAIPVRDGRRALDVFGRFYPQRTTEDGLTVLRGEPVETPEGPVQPAMYAALHGRILVIGKAKELVKRFDYQAALSGENLPPGSIAASLEIESVATRWKTALNTSRRMIEAMAPSGGDPNAHGPASPPALTGEPGSAAGTGSIPPPPPPPARASGTSGDEPVLVDGKKVEPPQLVVKVTPEYPEDARRAYIQGNVILEAIINRDGDVENVRVLRSVEGLDDAAVAAVKQWKYKPAMQDGHPVKVFFTVVVTFTLNEPDAGAGGSLAAAPGRAGGTGSTTGFPPLSRLRGFLDLYYGILDDGVDSLSKLQVSLEVQNGFLIVHGRGLARQGSTLAAFIEAQRDVGLPAIGRMMPANAPILVAGQLFWTQPSRVWLKQFLAHYRAAAAEMVDLKPVAERSPEDEFIKDMNLWDTHAAGMTDCMRGDLALAVDIAQNDVRMLQVQGVADTPACRGMLGSLVSSFKGGSEGRPFIEKDVLEPEEIATFVARPRQAPRPGSEKPAAEGAAGGLSVPARATADTAAPGGNAPTETDSPPGPLMRYAQVGDMLILGTDPWASKAIREAAAAREGSPPGGGGLVLADLGPFTQRPGVFGRMQMGSFLRASMKDAKEREANERLIEALEGPAGGIPFAMRFDEGAATLEVAFPLSLFEAFSMYAPKKDPSRSGPDVDLDGEEDAAGRHQP